MLFRKLFQPIRVGNLTVANRVVAPAMHNSLGDVEEGLTDRAIDFYVARARGGFGMVGVGIIDTYTWDHTPPHEMLLRTDKHMVRHQELVRRARAYGSIVVAQVGPRRVFHLSELRKGVRLSSVREEIIEAMIEQTVQAGVRAFEAGYDAVDILGAGASAASLFLSRIYNDRTDRWGGSVEGRSRFPVEIVRQIRQRVGRDAPIFFRLHGAEFLPGGYGLEEAREIAQRLCEAGVVFFNVTGGSHATSVPQLTPNVPRGTFAFLAREIRAATGVPVAAANRINHPFEAEELLRKGWADMVSIGRGSLADPEWPNKARRGETERIRLCVACNECQDIASVYEQPIRCLVNPRAGRVSEVEDLPRAERRKTVLVVGGGCAGLQAALTAAERGHQVSLCEKTSTLGGRWRVAYAPPGREELFNFLDWLARSARQAGVELRLETEVTPALVQAERPDVVLVTTGLRPKRPDLPGVDLPHVYTAEAVLEGDATLGQRIVVVGAGGVGVETASFLARRLYPKPEAVAFLQEFGGLLPEATEAFAQQQQQVYLVGRNPKLGVGLGPATRWVLNHELRLHGVQVLRETAVKEIQPDRVRVQGPQGERWIACDTVVLATGYEPDQSLYDALRPFAPEVYAVGDAAQAQHAVHTVGAAFMLGLSI